MKNASLTLMETENRMAVVLGLMDSRIDSGRDLDFQSLCGVFGILQGIDADIRTAREAIDRRGQGDRMEALKEFGRQAVREMIAAERPASIVGK